MGFSTTFDRARHRRAIAGTEMIVHCEHYNARLQATIEGTQGIDGRAMLERATERAASASIARLFGEHTAEATKYELVAAYYADVGLGKLHFERIAEGIVEQSSSAFVKGWKANFADVDRMTCTYTEGFLQGAYHAIHGEAVDVTEVACIHTGSPRCQFRIKRGRTTAIAPIRIKDQDWYRQQRPMGAASRPHLTSASVNNEMITDGVLQHMPLVGNDEGVCPVFIQADGKPAAHLASVPMDFYALLFTDYYAEMAKQRREDEARIRLIGSAEACSFYTWGKVLSSHEWQGMVGPMIAVETDKVYGLLALANMLGRGKWSVVAFAAGERLELESFDNYESEVFERLDFHPTTCSCSTMTGTATAYMNLVYPAHVLNTDGIGDFKTTEVSCIARGDDRCRFVCERRQLTAAEIAAQHGPDGLSCAI